MNYNTKRKDKARFILMLLLLTVMAAGIGYVIGSWCCAEEIKPDAVYPMANTNISWEQTFYSGGWTEVAKR